MRIHIVGKGCQRCAETERNVLQACADMALQAEIEQVRQLPGLAALGAWFMPAVVVDGKVVAAGKVPTVPELRRILTD
jgi:small redox-active disulfide protein 2